VETLKAVVETAHKLGRQSIIWGLLLTIVYLAHIKSPALSAVIPLAVAAITQYFQLKGDGGKGGK